MDPTEPQTDSPPPRAQAGLPVHSAEALLAGGTMALIVHGEQTYYLRKTRQGKLILNK